MLEPRVPCRIICQCWRWKLPCCQALLLGLVSNKSALQWLTRCVFHLINAQSKICALLEICKSSGGLSAGFLSWMLPTWKMLPKDSDYQSGKWKLRPAAPLDDNQCNLSVQSNIPTHTLYRIICDYWMGNDNLNGSSFLEQGQPATRITSTSSQLSFSYLSWQAAQKSSMK